MVSDLKSDLVMMSSQPRPNVHLMGNPAVCRRRVYLITVCLSEYGFEFCHFHEGCFVCNVSCGLSTKASMLVMGIIISVLNCID